MSNNYFTFKIPEFNSRFGTDFSDFTDIVEDNCDHLFEKTYQLYWLRDISKLSTKALERALKLRKIKYTTSDTVAVKRFKLRHWVSSFTNKGLAQTYIDLAKSITGEDGYFYTSTDGLVWGEWAWAPGEDNEWGGGAVASAFNIYFNVKTTDTNELDLIEALLNEKTYKPAFYQIILVDDDGNTLRTIS